jgi:hypothetical protein
MPRRIPTVGTKDLHTVQLSPQIRALLKRRADEAARREFAPVLAADRAALALPKQEYRAQAAATRGAANMTEDVLAQALQGLSGSGLSGRYLQQATSELSSRQGDAAASIPFLLADAASDRAAGVAEARQQLVGDRASMLQSAASAFNSALESERSKGATALKEQQDDRQAEREDTRDLTGFNNAYQVALTQYKGLLASAGQETKDGNIIQPPKTDQEWEEYAEHIAKEADGADQTEALEAVEALRKRLRELEHRGKLPQAGSAEEG